MSGPETNPLRPTEARQLNEFLDARLEMAGVPAGERPALAIDILSLALAARADGELAPSPCRPQAASLAERQLRRALSGGIRIVGTDAPDVEVTAFDKAAVPAAPPSVEQLLLAILRVQAWHHALSFGPREGIEGRVARIIAEALAWPGE